jgi:hypothetical protein
MGGAPVAGTDVEHTETRPIEDAELTIEEQDLVDRVEEIAADPGIPGILERPAPECTIFTEPFQ